MRLVKEPIQARNAASSEGLHRRIAELEAELRTRTKELAVVSAERDGLRRAYDRVVEQLRLLEKRIYAAKAERVDVAQLELEFAEKKAELEKLAGLLEEPPIESDIAREDDDAKAIDKDKARPKPKGRRDLRLADMPEVRVELLDPMHEESGIERLGFEESARAGYRRGGPVRIVTARMKYKTGKTDMPIVIAPKPKEIVSRGLLAPSMLAHILYSKYGMGLPFHRQEEWLSREGFDLSRGSMSRYSEEVGACLGGIVEACAKDAKANAFCLSTDATGIAIRPEPLPDKSRQSCRKGHFFVVLADRDHVFFEYQAKHTSDAVCSMFRGYSGYLQADAHAIYDALFRGEAVHAEAAPPTEVACWSHARRKAWEAASAKFVAGREALMRMRMLFELDATFAKLPPEKRKAMRQAKMRPLVDDFFAWAQALFNTVKNERGLVSTAFGYVVRQELALRRFLDDGRLVMTNNASERALRSVAVGRKNWLFFGSDDHASAAANLFSLIASCKLHGLDPEQYLFEIIRVLPYWPQPRLLELSPRDWNKTRARLDPAELATELGPFKLPPEQQDSAH
jgi:transposase